MIFFFICIALVLVVIIGDFKREIWGSKQRMINAEWLDDAKKFELIARWGA